MNGSRFRIWLGAMLLVSGELWGQPSFSFRGKASAWSTVNPSQELSLWSGGRYTPETGMRESLATDIMLDLEASLTIAGSVGVHPFDSLRTEGDLKPYRVWMRVSASQWEVRLGLQKINFGSSTLLRPLMWFDRVDPRDPLQLCDGVWGLLGRYYFLNNANIWLWGLYGNEDPKAWELSPTASKTPEFGGRVQVPVPRGEVAFTFHHRRADLTSSELFAEDFSTTAENRCGLDLKVDVEVGLWAEGAWMGSRRDLGASTHQQILNMGIDYTFGLGNGLHGSGEHLIVSHAQDPFVFEHTTHLSAGSMSYPLNVLDSISAIVYYDWTNKDIYAFADWQRQLNRFTFHLMSFRNPKSVRMPNQSTGAGMLTGTGLQVMAVFNH